MKDGFSHIVVVLDKSGSMQKVQQDTIGGFNNFIEEQKRVPGEATLTLVQFSDKIETVFSDVPLNHVAALTKENYKCGGWTSLNDALAKTINEVGVKLAAKPEHERPSKVIVLIMTDGEENSSKEYGGFNGLNKIKEMITHQKEKYSWNFVFIGSNIDAFAAAAPYGINKKDTINYFSSGMGVNNAFKSISRGITASRLSNEPLASFFENEKDSKIISDNILDTMDIKQTIDKYIKKEKIDTSKDNGNNA